jgi:ankyrin repeat protein
MSSVNLQKKPLTKDYSEISRRKPGQDQSHFRSISINELLPVQSKDEIDEKELFLKTHPLFWKGEPDIFKNNPRSSLAQISIVGTLDKLNHEIEKIKKELKEKYKDECKFQNVFKQAINSKSGPRERTALHFSLTSFEKYQLLLESGADVFAVDKDLNNCLHIACALGLSIEVIADLVSDKKLDVNALNKAKLTPLHYVNSICVSQATRQWYTVSETDSLGKKHTSDSELRGFFCSEVNVNKKLLEKKKYLFALLFENGADVNLVPNLDTELLKILKELDFLKYTKYLDKQKKSRASHFALKLHGVEKKEKKLRA